MSVSLCSYPTVESYWDKGHAREGSVGKQQGVRGGEGQNIEIRNS